MSRLKNIGYTFLGNAIFSFVKWLILILIVRLTTPEQVGSYTFSVALTTPILLCANMRIRLRYVVEDDLHFNDLRVLRNILNITSLIIIIVIGFLVYPGYLSLMILVAINKILDLQSELYYAVFHKKQNFRVISFMQIGKSLLIIVPFFLVVLISKNVILALITQSLIQLLWLIFVEKRTVNHIGKSQKHTQNKKLIFSMLIAGLPLGIVQLLNSYNILIPRYVIERFVNVEAVGIFASISYLLTVIDLFMNAISQNIVIKIKNTISNSNYKKLLAYINRDVFIFSILLGALVIVPVYFFNEFIVGIIYGSNYEKYSIVFLIISISIIFNFQSWIFDTTLMAFKVYKLQLIASIINVFISIISSLVLIKLYGLIGASIAVVVITLSQAATKYLLVIFCINKEKRG